MTSEQNKAIKNFAHIVGGFADISRFHLKRILGEQEYEARGEIDGYYQDLIDARDALMLAFQDEPQPELQGAFDWTCTYCHHTITAPSRFKLHERMYNHLAALHGDEEDVHGKLDNLHDAMKEHVAGLE